MNPSFSGHLLHPPPSSGKTTPGTRGEGFLDIHLKATTRWKDVPQDVWHYTLGGYQVLKKWLSYRESTLLGRPLTADEAQQIHPPHPPHRQHPNAKSRTGHPLQGQFGVMDGWNRQ